MNRDSGNDHPLQGFFTQALDESLHERLQLERQADVEAYLVQMLVRFLHEDNIYGIKDSSGRPVRSVAEMVAEGDVRLNATSFAREREVHRHIGDFLLFWSGLFPEFLRHMAGAGTKDMLIDCVKQGQFSYHVVSTFEHDPYGGEVETFKKLSADFEAYRIGLSLLRASFEGFANQGWTDGFRA